jgi:hypothetical protein
LTEKYAIAKHQATAPAAVSTREQKNIILIDLTPTNPIILDRDGAVPLFQTPRPL